jgi:hypothetical protein
MKQLFLPILIISLGISCSKSIDSSSSKSPSKLSPNERSIIFKIRGLYGNIASIKSSIYNAKQISGEWVKDGYADYPENHIM